MAKEKGWRERLAKEKDLPKRKASRRQWLTESKGWPKRKDGQKEGMAEAGTPRKWSENGLKCFAKSSERISLKEN